MLFLFCRNMGEEVYDKAVVAVSRNGHVTLIEALVAAGTDVNEGREKHIKHDWYEESYYGAEGNTALIVAVQNNQRACIETILRLVADVNETGEDNRTALVEAIEAFSDEIDIPLKLIQAGADVNYSAYRGSALEYASRKAYINTVTLLLQLGATINGTQARLKASSEGHIDAVKLLIDSGANVNDEPLHDDTALVGAASNGHVDLVKLLLEAGANVNLVAKHGETALQKSVSAGNFEIVKLLTQAGADLNYVSGNDSYYESTALFIASSSGRMEIVKYLIEAGADVSMAGAIDEGFL